MRAILSLCFATVFFATAEASDRVTNELFATRSAVLASNGMAATSQPLATQVALDILKQGGNAVDAAIAANAMLGLVEPTGNGIGGDLFAIVWDAKSQKLHGLNASGRSPKSLSYETLKGLLEAEDRDGIPPYGPLPVSVPGTVDGWYELHERFGKLPMDQLLQPTIDYGRAGFPLTDLIAYYWGITVQRWQNYPDFIKQFTIDGKAPAKGQIFKNPNLANTLERIAKGGREVFYQGEIALAIERFMQDQGGYLTAQDMAEHRSEWVQPLSANYRGYDVWELPPNTQGIAALQILNILEGFDLKKYGFGSPEHIHYFTEATKLVFADRAVHYADMDFAETPLRQLLSQSYADKRRKQIQPKRAGKQIQPGIPALNRGDTIYLTTADSEGNMVSLIQSNYRGMGSGMAPPGLGFVLQDRGQLFSMEADHANVYAPGKRPFHTIIPAFITKDGKPYMSFGLMGGAMQPQGHAQIVINMVDFGMDVQEAGDAPRIYWQSGFGPTGGEETDGGTLHLETGFPYASIRELLRYGHKVSYALGPYGGYQAILRDPETGVYHGASESRKDGQAAGY